MNESEVDILYKQLRKKVKDARKAKKLSIRKLAAMAQCEPTLIDEFEKTSRDIRVSNLLKICIALDIELFISL